MISAFEALKKWNIQSLFTFNKYKMHVVHMAITPKLGKIWHMMCYHINGKYFTEHLRGTGGVMRGRSKKNQPPHLIFFLTLSKIGLINNANKKKKKRHFMFILKNKKEILNKIPINLCKNRHLYPSFSTKDMFGVLKKNTEIWFIGTHLKEELNFCTKFVQLRIL